MLPSERRIQRQFYPSTKPFLHERGRFSSISIYPHQGRSRFSFSISKKIARRAVVRNKMRRWGYQIVRELLPSLEEGFLVRFSIHSVPDEKDAFRDELVKLLKKVKITTT